MKTVVAALAASILAGGVAAADTINLAAVASQTDVNKSVAVTKTLAAGTYQVTEAGLAGGGTFDAYTVYAPTASNGAYADDWWYTVGGVDTWTKTGSRYNTAAQALSAYQALGPTTFTLTAASTVSFYLADYAYPNFADDSGGVSLNIAQVAVPEPASIALLGLGMIGFTVLLRRRLAH